MSQHKGGFTLIELLIVIAILAILSSILVTGFRSYQLRQTLELSTKEVRQLLERARSQTLAATNDSTYGVHIGSSTFTLFAGEEYAPGGASNEVYELDRRIEISTTTLSPATDTITFARGTGEPSASGFIEVMLVDNPEEKRTISISATGIINSNE